MKYTYVHKIVHPHGKEISKVIRCQVNVTTQCKGYENFLLSKQNIYTACNPYLHYIACKYAMNISQLYVTVLCILQHRQFIMYSPVKGGLEFPELAVRGKK